MQNASLCCVCAVTSDQGQFCWTEGHASDLPKMQGHHPVLCIAVKTVCHAFEGLAGD